MMYAGPYCYTTFSYTLAITVPIDKTTKVDDTPHENLTRGDGKNEALATQRGDKIIA
jgi:hypothetical protein